MGKGKDLGGEEGRIWERYVKVIDMHMDALRSPQTPPPVPHLVTANRPAMVSTTDYNYPLLEAENLLISTSLLHIVRNGHISDYSIVKLNGQVWCHGCALVSRSL